MELSRVMEVWVLVLTAQVETARVAIKKTVVSFIVMICFEEFVLLIISLMVF